MYIDFHTHILPDIDDGAKDIEMALEMISIANENDADTIILTPHINATADFKNFLQVRKKKYGELRSAIKKSRMNCPDLLLGAEVMLDGALSEKENVQSLCIEGTSLLLLELPYTHWNDWYNHEIYNIISNHNIMPVLAHIERYLTSPKDIKKLDSLASFGVKFQVNASSFLSFSGRRIIRELAANGLISAIGSDAHNLSRRSPDISKALRAFSRKFGPDFIEYIYKKSDALLDDYKFSTSI